MTDETQRLERRLIREKRARKEAEHLLEEKATELFHANQELQSLLKNQEILIQQRTTQLEEALKAAEQANQQKSRFLANVSHEIRTPMNAIIGLTDIVLQSSLEETQQDYLEKVRLSAENLLHLINDVLDFSKIESGHLAIEHVEFSLDNILQQVYQVNDQKASEKNLQFTVSRDISCAGEFRGDPLRLGQILINLVSNAIKFTETGQVNLTVRTLEKSPQQQKLLFEITDTGIGIPEHRIEQLFEAFTQADDSTTRHYGGTGLGLSICKQLCELMQGNITVRSQPGSGSTFSVTLPFDTPSVSENTFQIRSVERKTVSDTSTQTTLSERDFSAARILLVEDNAINTLVATAMLEQFGITPDCAENGIIALQKLDQASYDLVFMDIQMPEMDGYTATKAIRQQDRTATLPVIALTANAIDGDKQKSIQAGMNDYMSKPFRAEDLLHILEKWLPA